MKRNLILGVLLVFSLPPLSASDTLSAQISAVAEAQNRMKQAQAHREQQRQWEAQQSAERAARLAAAKQATRETAAARQASEERAERLERDRIATEERIRLEKIRSAERLKKKKVVALATAKAKETVRLKNNERLLDKSRDQAFEDQLRLLEIEERKSELEAKKARVARANDFIDHELKRYNAETDVVQSEADATRNVSSGTKDMLSGIGKGAGGKSWFR